MLNTARTRAPARTVALTTAIAFALAGALSACADTGPGTGAASSGGETITLVSSKGPVQLLRNEVASRLPEDKIASADASVDNTEACGDEAKDPEGLLRSWTSSVTVRLTDSAAPQVDTIVDDLAASFTEQGWKIASQGGSAILHKRYLSQDSRQTTIDIWATSDDADATYIPATDLTTASIVISAHGACVTTNGPNSDEVKDAEGR